MSTSCLRVPRQNISQTEGLITVQANEPRPLPGFQGFGRARNASEDSTTARTNPLAALNPWATASPETQRRTRRVVTRALTGIALAALVFVLVLVGFRMAYGGKVYPAISVAGVALGGMPRDEASAALGARVDQLNTESVVFTFEGQEFRPTLAELGVTFDTDRSLAEAYAYGREADAVDRLRVAGDLLQSDHQVPLYASVDYATLNAWFDGVDQQLGLVPHDAFLAIDGTDVRIEPEVEGTVVDRELAGSQIMAAVTDLVPSRTDLPVVAWIPNVRSGDLTGAEAQVRAALSEPIEIAFADQSWTLQPAQISQFIIQDNDKSKLGADAVSLRVDEVALAEFLSLEFATAVYLEPVDAEVGWNQGPVSVEWSTDGHELRPEAFATEVAASMMGDHRAVTIPVNVLKPAVDSNNLGALGITSQLGRGDSNYSGSDYGRATNIGVGANLLNGTLVAPGEIFSFNQSIGVISTELGYVEARVIMAERIGRGIGGGICQVSTTVFRAAMRAGLPIAEWWPHAQRIEFYERDGWGPGFDASILQPDEDPMSGGDFKFENPTDGWLLIESFVDGSHVVVNIYGPETKWDVQLGEPVQSDPIPPTEDIEVVNHGMEAGCVVHSEAPLDGLAVSFTRTVLDATTGEVVREYTYETYFKSNGNVYIVSPDQQGASPASGGSNFGNCDFSAIPF